jgi:multiple sugar transport system permease protein
VEKSLARKEARVALLFLLPNLTGFLLFTFLPVVASLFLSFVSWDMINPARFVEFRNFSKAFNDATFWTALYNTAYYTFCVVPLEVGGALTLALALNQKIRGLSVYRSIYFLPTVCSTVAVAAIWKWLYEPQFGLINNFLQYIGVQGPAWLSSTRWAMPAVIIMAVWKGIGFNMVIFLAGLQGVPKMYYEAAAIDGAGNWRKFRHVTIPLLAPSIFFVTITSLINSFQVFNIVYILTEGGPGDSTRTLVQYIYDVAYNWLQMGYGATLSWLLALCVFGITLVQWRAQKRWTNYD